MVPHAMENSEEPRGRRTALCVQSLINGLVFSAKKKVISECFLFDG